MEEKILEILTSLSNKIDKLSEDVNTIKTRLATVEEQTAKNIIILEKLQSDIRTIAEVHQSHVEQNQQSFEELKLMLNNKTALLSDAISAISSDVKETQKVIEVLKEMTGKHEVDIRILQKQAV